MVVSSIAGFEFRRRDAQQGAGEPGWQCAAHGQAVHRRFGRRGTESDVVVRAHCERLTWWEITGKTGWMSFARTPELRKTRRASGLQADEVDDLCPSAAATHFQN